ncbi:MAG TPA: nucleotide exchange factor GrpE [Thermoanaerobaculia bacterium]|nr:nucleotide exchange factor GrpE [Thermoanaerobaculia bacterium]HUM29404.1 nucleotide exchange factor GrpE [Thermoanaerobaculia bacterium]HXK67650.1 nucleotide exchange factor GrpE [Thermoanaerobaculia bacterium]
MTDDKHNNDEVTIIEDTGESLDDFSLEDEERKAESIDSPNDSSAELKAELDTMKDRYLRTLAELDNLKKRTARDREDQVRFALTSFYCEFLPIVDNFHRAVQSEGSDVAAFHEGVTLILKQIDNLLEKMGVREIITQPGDAFDPHVHEAVSSEPSGDVKEPSIGEVFQKGYLLNDRLLRPVLVRVLMPVPGQKGEANGESAGD